MSNVAHIQGSRTRNTREQMLKGTAIKAKGAKKKVALELKNKPLDRSMPTEFIGDHALEAQWLWLMDALPDGMLAKADRNELINYAATIVTINEQRVELRNESAIMRTTTGFCINPRHNLIDKLVHTQIALSKSIGICATARSKLMLDPSTLEDQGPSDDFGI